MKSYKQHALQRLSTKLIAHILTTHAWRINMDCPKCGDKLSVLRQAEIMDAEVDLSWLKREPVTLPDGLKLCEKCWAKPVDSEVLH